MKAIFSFCIILLIAVGSYILVATGKAQHFGPAFTLAKVTPLAQAVKEADRIASGPLRVQGKIVRQCPSAGCWFFLEDTGGIQLRVDLGHMGIKFPQRVGRTATVEGRLVKSGSTLELVGDNVEFN